MTICKIVNNSNHLLPEYSTDHSAGMDLRASISEPIILQPMERALISTGLFLEIPEGFEAQVRPRSGLAIKSGISIVNSPGTIDSDYRGEVKVILINLGNEPFTILNGDRIAQLVFAKYEKITWEHVAILNESERGSGGFGSSGKN